METLCFQMLVYAVKTDHKILRTKSILFQESHSFRGDLLNLGVENSVSLKLRRHRYHKYRSKLVR